MRKNRYNYSPEEEVIILNRYLAGRKRYRIFALEKVNSKKVEKQRIHQHGDKLLQKREVHSELLEEHVQFKRT